MSWAEDAKVNPERFMKCSQCNWVTLRWRTRKRDGQVVHGYKSLRHHFEITHPKMFRAVENTEGEEE